MEIYELWPCIVTGFNALACFSPLRLVRTVGIVVRFFLLWFLNLLFYWSCKEFSLHFLALPCLPNKIKDTSSRCLVDRNFMSATFVSVYWTLMSKQTERVFLECRFVDFIDCVLVDPLCAIFISFVRSWKTCLPVWMINIHIDKTVTEYISLRKKNLYQTDQTSIDWMSISFVGENFLHYSQAALVNFIISRFESEMR